MLATGPIILALDPGRLTGVAEGIAGGIPRSITWTLADPQDGLTVQCTELLRNLNKRLLQAPRPSLIVTEAPLGLAAFRALGTSEASIRSAYALAAVVAGIAGMFSIGSREVPVGQVTKHFTGRVRHGGRESRKAAIVSRCRQLGYVPRDCTDDDRCDALAVWDFACAHLARRPARFVLFDAA